MNAWAEPCLKISLFILQMVGAAILAFLGNRSLQRIQSREERRSRQFEEDMVWLERYLSAMSLCLDVVEAMRRQLPAALPLRQQAAQLFMEITPERDVRLMRVRSLNDVELNGLLDQFSQQCREFGIEDLQVGFEQLVTSATDELLTRMRVILLLAKHRAGELRSQGPPNDPPRCHLGPPLVRQGERRRTTWRDDARQQRNRKEAGNCIKERKQSIVYWNHCGLSSSGWPWQKPS